MKLEGQVAVVTGAGRNIGEAIAKLLATEGAKIAVVDLDQARGKMVAGAIGARLAKEQRPARAHGISDTTRECLLLGNRNVVEQIDHGHEVVAAQIRGAQVGTVETCVGESKLEVLNRPLSPRTAGRCTTAVSMGCCARSMR